jgi:hypothetical protein
LPSSWLKTIQQYLKGFFLFGMLEGISRQKQHLDELFRLSVLGHLIGIPGLFNYYHLRLMPFYIGQIASWKRRVLRERDFFDHISE